MTDLQQIVVVGGGLAGAKTVEALREQGFTGSVALLCEEAELPYERPPLSKDFLLGKASRNDPQVHDATWYVEKQIDLRLGVAATGLDRAAQKVTLDDSSTLTYDALVLATGSSPRRLPLPGADSENVRYLRRIGDSEALRAAFGPDQRVVLIGGGWIGLEVAAAARQSGADVTVVEAAEQPLLAVLGARIAPVFGSLHIDHGVELLTSASVESIEVNDGKASGLRLKGGRILPADTIVVGIGVSPNVDVARAAGLDLDNGVLVDAGLRTSDPHIWAVGDIANLAHPFLGRRIRVEHWASALNQPAVAAATILGRQAEFDDLPYFFTDQYDLGMEYIGSAAPDAVHSVVVRGDLAAREFIAFWLDPTGTVLAGMNVNIWDVVDDVKALIRSRRPVDQGRLQDKDVPLAELLG